MNGKITKSKLDRKGLGKDIFAALTSILMLYLTYSWFYENTLLFVMFFYIAVLIVILYLLSLSISILSCLKNGIQNNRFKIFIHLIVLFSIMFIILLNSELFKSKQMLSATLKDDLFHYKLVLRENGIAESYIYGFLGFNERASGKYIILNDTIFFTENPFRNNFISDTILINRNQNAIFFKRKPNGEYYDSKTFLNYFEIERLK